MENIDIQGSDLVKIQEEVKKLRGTLSKARDTSFKKKLSKFVDGNKLIKKISKGEKIYTINDIFEMEEEYYSIEMEGGFEGDNFLLTEEFEMFIAKMKKIIGKDYDIVNNVEEQTVQIYKKNKDEEIELDLSDEEIAKLNSIEKFFYYFDINKLVKEGAIKKEYVFKRIGEFKDKSVFEEVKSQFQVLKDLDTDTYSIPIYKITKKTEIPNRKTSKNKYEGNLRRTSVTGILTNDNMIKRGGVVGKALPNRVNSTGPVRRQYTTTYKEDVLSWEEGRQMFQDLLKEGGLKDPDKIETLRQSIIEISNWDGKDKKGVSPKRTSKSSKGKRRKSVAEIGVQTGPSLNREQKKAPDTKKAGPSGIKKAPATTSKPVTKTSPSGIDTRISVISTARRRRRRSAGKGRGHRVLVATIKTLKGGKSRTQAAKKSTRPQPKGKGKGKEKTRTRAGSKKVSVKRKSKRKPRKRVSKKKKSVKRRSKKEKLIKL